MKFDIYEDYSEKVITFVRELFAEYEQSLGFPLDFQNFDKELENLPGEYTPPEGCIFLCKVIEDIAGCIALRKLEPGICELKRMYVRKGYRGKGMGKQLADKIIERAKEIGYRIMRLDTLRSMTTPIKIYEELGFREIKAYRYNPFKNAVYMEKEL
ncbi:MAG: GNAT family N-acetyltransferase [Candidatus Cloacimonetes bacterium]|nr:GNAT family N-acetyltransferase [Candidatus Cloacimonadota bacterium]